MTSESKPAWWPKNPYPEDIFPATVEEYIKLIPDPQNRTAISGLLMRLGWDVASDMIWRAWQEEQEDAAPPALGG